MDCNGDRMPDLFFAGGKEPAQLFVNQSKAGGALNFKACNRPQRTRFKKTSGAYPIDFDNDGLLDLVSFAPWSQSLAQRVTGSAVLKG